MSQNTVRIPHPLGDIVGILQVAPSNVDKPISPKQTRPITLIMHGVLAHMNQSFHRRLADALANECDCDSFRYDLRGQGGQTEGPWNQLHDMQDIEDLQAVVKYLLETGYDIRLVVAHSRGSAIVSWYLSCFDHPPIPYFVNVSGRYDMTQIRYNKRYNDAFAKHGYLDWHVKIAGKPIVRRVTPEASKEFAEWNNDYLQMTFPQDVHVLNIHGDADETVPVNDAYMLHKIFSQRSTGTSSLVITKGDGHNFRRPFDEPVNGIMGWVHDKVFPSKAAGGSKAKL